MKLTIRTAAIGIVVLFAGGILLSSALGFWKTESSKEVAKLKTGEFAGLPNPADIRGSYSWNDVSRNFNIDVGVLLKAFNASDPEAKVKTLEEIAATMSLPPGVELGTDSVRVFVSLYAGIPYEDAESTTWLPLSAAEILKSEGKGDKDIIQRIYENSVRPAASQTASAPATTPAPAPATSTAPAKSTAPVATAPATTTAPAAAPATAPASTSAAAPATPSVPAAAGTTSTTTETHEEKPAYTVTGKTTFGELKLWGVPRDKLQEVLGAEPGPDPLALKDWASQNEKSFSELKTKVQQLVDTVKK